MNWWQEKNKDIGVALLQSVTKKLPSAEVAYINLDHAVVSDEDIRVGTHVYTLGFPMGFSAQDLKSYKGIQLLARGGNITQESNDYHLDLMQPLMVVPVARQY